MVSDFKLFCRVLLGGKVYFYCAVHVIALNLLSFLLPLPILAPHHTARGNVGLSAVCAYSMTAVEDVFSKGKYMQKATVEQSHTKWVRYNGITPSPRPGAVSTVPTIQLVCNHFVGLEFLSVVLTVE